VPPRAWLRPSKSDGPSKLRLFCFPYAGGAASIYRMWPHIVPRTVEVCPVHPPGRGHRAADPPLTSAIQMAREVAREAAVCLDVPFAVFGHSFGGIVAFEFVRELRRTHGVLPVHLLVSGCHAPHFRRRADPIHRYSEAEFLREIESLGGTPAELLADRELMEMFLPVLRADFQAFYEYEYVEGPKIDCPITAYGGLRDPQIQERHLRAWREHTTKDFELHVLPGDHFFLTKNQATFFPVLGSEIGKLAARIGFSESRLSA